MGLLVMFSKDGFLCNENLVTEEAERDLKPQLPRKKYGPCSLMLKRRICQTEFALSAALGAFGEFVGGLRRAHKISGSGWCLRAVLGWVGFLRHQ